jgi:hypothetical protein
MIDARCFTPEWVESVRRTMPRASPLAVEKSIHALALLERLAQSNLRFLFKGGTCMLLHLQQLRRLSVDIDIVYTDGLPGLVPVLEVIGGQRPFLRYTSDERNPDRRPRRKHFRFYYDSLDAGNPEPFVLLDVVHEQVQTPFIERKAVAVAFVETDAPPVVTVPTLNGLLGDKLTAFAPETVGVPYGPRSSQQIVKQMFDVGELLGVATDLGHVRQAHEAAFTAENGFRRNRFQLRQALDDSIKTAFHVSQLDLRGEQPWDSTKRRMLREGVAAINVTLLRESYTLADARVSASRAALLAALLRYGETGPLATYRFSPARLRQLPAALTGRYAVLNPLRETSPETFFHWSEVSRLETLGRI